MDFGQRLLVRYNGPIQYTSNAEFKCRLDKEAVGIMHLICHDLTNKSAMGRPSEICHARIRATNLVDKILAYQTPK
jgi:hypothetical protein